VLSAASTRAAARAVALGVVLLLGATFAGCTRDPLVRQQSYVFGTLVEIAVWDRDEARARGAIARVLREFDRLHGVLHAWKPSELTRLNAALAKGEAAEVSPELSAILTDAKRLAELSGESFDPAIGALVALWGFHADEFHPVSPDPAALARLVDARPSMADVTIAGTRVSSTNPAVRLDLGGYAKGYALDVAQRMLRADGIENALVNIGGNIVALGEHGDRPWRVGIQHPRKAGPIASVDLYDGEAIGTSGDYQRFFESGGKRYCHLLDPRTGAPVQGVEAVTVIAPRGPGAGALSDAASKPPFVAGPAGWRAAVARMGIDNALLIDAHGVVHATERMAKRMTLIENGLTVRTE
jgi:FAD:protein FMN transferase